MSKHKTKKQKIKSLEKRKNSAEKNMQITQDTTPIVVSANQKTYTLNQATLPIRNYKATYSRDYLSKDLFKTITLSTTIIAVQILLFFLLKSHIINISSIKY